VENRVKRNLKKFTKVANMVITLKIFIENVMVNFLQLQLFYQENIKEYLEGILIYHGDQAVEINKVMEKALFIL